MDRLAFGGLVVRNVDVVEEKSSGIGSSMLMQGIDLDESLFKRAVKMPSCDT